MAELRTAVSMIDGISPVIKHMTSAMNIIINSFGQMEHASANAIDVSSLNAARSELARVGTAMQQVENNIEQAAQQQNNLNNQIKNGDNAAGGLASKIGGMIAAYATMQSALSLASLTDDYVNIGSRLDLINDGLQTTAELQEMVRDSANRTFSNYKDTADMVGKLGVQAADAFSSNQDILNFAEQINKHLAIAGTNGAAAQGAMIQLTQAMSNGVLRGEELNSVMDGMPTVVKAIQGEFAKMGDTRGIKKIAEDGLITADIVKQALFNTANDTNAKFAAMGVTFVDVWNLFKNNADKAMTPVYKKLGELTNNAAFQQFAANAGAAIATLAGGMVWVFEKVAALGMVISQNWENIAPALAIAAGALAGYSAILMISIAREKIAAAWKGAVALASAIKAAATGAEATATQAATMAQWGLNAAIYAFPGFWIVAAVLAIVAVFFLAVAAWNYFTGESVSGVGLIVGSIYWLGAVFANIIFGIANAGLTVAEFLVNTYNKVVFNIEKFFYNLAMDFLDDCYSMAQGWDGFANAMAEAFVGAINTVIDAWNGFMDLLPDKVKTTLSLGKGSHLSAGTVNTAGMVAAARGALKAPTAPEQVNLGRANYINTSKAFDNGYNAGTKLADKGTAAVKEMFGFGGGETGKGKEKTAEELMKAAGLGKYSPAEQLGNGAGGGKGGSGGGGGDSAFASHNHQYVGRKRFLVHNALQAGEGVILAQLPGGQQFIVLDRKG